MVYGLMLNKEHVSLRKSPISLEQVYLTLFDNTQPPREVPFKATIDDDIFFQA